MFKDREILKQLKNYWNSSEAVIITGMRRTGKSTLLKYVYNKIDSKNKLYLDFENPINRKYFESDNYERVKSSLEILGLDFGNSRPYIFMDEIEYLGNLPSIINYFMDNYKVKFFLTGSINPSSKRFYNKFSKGIYFELFPLNFKEFLLFKGTKINPPGNRKDVTKPIFDILSNHYEEFILFGGFPEVVLKKTIEEKKKSLENIFASFFKLEVVQFSSFRKSELIRDLVLLLMQRIGKKLDIQKLSIELGISRATVYEYISFLEDTYFIKTIKPLVLGNVREIRKSPKIYVCDSGLINHFVRVGEEELFENSVIQNLMDSSEIMYYQRKGGAGIDFIINRDKAYDVKVVPHSADIKRFKKICEELNFDEYKIISKNYIEDESVEYGFTI